MRPSLPDSMLDPSPSLSQAPGRANLQPPLPSTLQAPPPLPSLPARLSEAVGTWDLARDGTNRRCVLTLRLASGEAGRQIAFPAGCRRALPVVGGIAGWLFTDGVVRLVDRNVRPVLLFIKRRDERSLVAVTEAGESFSLVPLDTAGMRPAGEGVEAGEAAAGARPDPAPSAPPAERIAASVEPPATAVPASAADDNLVGLYALDRFQDRDTCRVRLAPGGRAERIAEGCRDGGLEIFDPARWRFADGRLTLTARRGHSIALVQEGDGRWRRDPETGTTFVLRRLAP